MLCSSDCQQVLLWNHCSPQQRQPVPCSDLAADREGGASSLPQASRSLGLLISVRVQPCLLSDGGPELEVLFQMPVSYLLWVFASINAVYGGFGATVRVKAPASPCAWIIRAACVEPTRLSFLLVGVSVTISCSGL